MEKEKTHHVSRYTGSMKFNSEETDKAKAKEQKSLAYL